MLQGCQSFHNILTMAYKLLIRPKALKPLKALKDPEGPEELNDILGALKEHYYETLQGLVYMALTDTTCVPISVRRKQPRARPLPSR